MKKPYTHGTTSEGSTFWIAYADLMAGLLFVFILIIGGVIVKYMLLKNESQLLEKDLRSQKNALQKSQQELRQQQLQLIAFQNSLQTKEEAIRLTIQKLQEAQAESGKKEEHISALQLILEKFEADLLAQKSGLDAAGAQIGFLKSALGSKEDELKKLLERLTIQEQENSKILADLMSTREKIKNLTGLRVRLITTLKKALGDHMELDPKSGAIRLSASILFDTGKAELKPEALAQIEHVLRTYIDTLLSNPQIIKHLDKIVIEGHTDSTGSYLYNLELSQKRAFEVMRYLFALDYDKEEALRQHLAASGRAYLDRIVENGVENQEASRRIEIKFLLKNEEAMREIEALLDQAHP
ncbi:MAG: OmpA family protein [Campylobacterales bacterium]|nr:OmpA family protein [Campylobacterales bacterium]